MLRVQKPALIGRCKINPALEVRLNWVDSLQDTAENTGCRVFGDE